MRLSTFEKYLFWTLLLTASSCCSFMLAPENSNPSFWTIGKFLPIGILFVASVILSDDLSDIIAYKYKIIEEQYTIRAKVYTTWWLFIPHWKSVETESHSFKNQNIFGGEYKDYCTTDMDYQTKQQAVDAIEKHKRDRKEAQSEFFARPKKDDKKVTYL